MLFVRWVPFPFLDFSFWRSVNWSLILLWHRALRIFGTDSGGQSARSDLPEPEISFPFPFKILVFFLRSLEAQSRARSRAGLAPQDPPEDGSIDFGASRDKIHLREFFLHGERVISLSVFLGAFFFATSCGGVCFFSLCFFFFFFFFFFLVEGGRTPPPGRTQYVEQLRTVGRPPVPPPYFYDDPKFRCRY